MGQTPSPGELAGIDLQLSTLPTGPAAAAERVRLAEHALHGLRREDEPLLWSSLQNHLGVGCSELPTGDRRGNLLRAIDCFQAALTVRSRKVYPADWAMTQSNLGNVYSNLQGGDRAESLRRAIEHFEAALEVYRPETTPGGWAMAMGNLGNAYRDLPTGDPVANIQKAIECYEAALAIEPPEQEPAQWAMTRSNCGIAHLHLPAGDRRANLRRAIDCYTAALTVYSRDANPYEWAMVQANMGTTYRGSAWFGNASANREQALVHHRAALGVFTTAAFPTEWSRVVQNLAFTLVDLGRQDEARDLLDEALGQARDCGLQDVVAYLEAVVSIVLRTVAGAHRQPVEHEAGATDALTETGSGVGGDGSLPLDGPKRPLAAYCGDEPYVFVSYSHQDAREVYLEVQRLHDDGYRLWYDEGIDAGTEWPEVIGRKVEQCACFVVFVSPRAVSSRNVRDEIHRAKNLERRVVLVYLEDTTLTPGLSLRTDTTQAVMKHEAVPEEYQQIMRRALPPSTRRGGLA